MNLETVNLSSSYELKDVTEFLSKFDIKYSKEAIDYTVLIRENDEIVATASKYKNIIKFFAISEKMQGQGISGTVLTNVMNKIFEEGYHHSMVFSKRENTQLFVGMGYKEISHTDKVVFLEIGSKNITKTIEDIKSEYEINYEGQKAMIVMNCNPFTLGHLYIVEKAASENKEVLLFVVEEDKSLFPFEVRYDLVKKGVAHLKNVKVIKGTQYIISSATFPTYFLKQEDDFLMEYTKLDATITGQYFCKILNISKRYLGEEPFCEVTSIYNLSIKNILPEFGVEVVIVPRKVEDGTPISASLVRKYISEDKYDLIKDLVPSSTYDFLISKKGKEIAEKIKDFAKDDV